MALVINRFNLPNELHSIIKDFAFPNKERKIIMDLHNQICDNISCLTISISIMDNKIRWALRWPNILPLEKDLLAYFCGKCGNYEHWYLFGFNPCASCKCHINNRI